MFYLGLWRCPKIAQMRKLGSAIEAFLELRSVFTFLIASIEPHNHEEVWFITKCVFIYYLWCQLKSFFFVQIVLNDLLIALF